MNILQGTQCSKGLIDSYGSDGKQAWWFKFQINVDHPLAWQTVQELGHVLNYISKMSACRLSLFQFLHRLI